MFKLSPADMLFYSTTRLAAGDNGVVKSTGTGFFVQFDPQEDGRTIPALITNKHVVRDADFLDMSMHVGDGEPSGDVFDARVSLRPNNVAYHPDPDVDLCAVLIGPIAIQAHAAGKKLFFVNVDLAIIPREPDWAQFDAIEEITMIGCPNGLYDASNNLPIARRGITATPLSKRYNDKDEFLVDIACFPGSSGSPIFIFDQGGHYSREQGSFMIGGARIFLVGVLYAGPLITADGRIVLGQVPKIEVPGMMHLGNALRSSAVLDLEAEAIRIATAPPVQFKPFSV